MTIEQQEPRWHKVIDRDIKRHVKPGSPDSVCVEYLVEGFRSGPYISVREWVCLEHNGFPRSKAVQWWSAFGPRGVAPPDNVAHALRLSESIRTPTSVVLKRDGRYWRVDRVRFEEPAEVSA